MSDGELSDHRTVCMRDNVENRRFTRGVHDHEQKVPKIRWERLTDSEIKEKYERRTEELTSE